MAVSHKLYGPSMNNATNGGITSLTTELLVSLMATAGFSFTQDNQWWSTISTAEVSTGTYASYPSSGVVLAGLASSYTDKVTTLTATSETEFCSSGTISSPFAVIRAASYLISCVDFDGTESSVDGKFSINWTDNKILTITVAS